MAIRKNNKAKILATARRLFLKYGYNGISIRSIAREAKLTTGAVYFHFKNKMDIYRTICLEAIGILADDFKESVEKRRKTGQKLIATFDSYIRFYYKYSDHYNILMEYKASYDKDGGEGKSGISARMGDLIKISQDTIEQGIENNEIRSLDPTMLSLFLAAIAEGMLQYKKMGLFDFYGISDKDFRKFMSEMIGRGIQSENKK